MTENSVLLAQKGEKKIRDKIVKKNFLITTSFLIFIYFRWNNLHLMSWYILIKKYYRRKRDVSVSFTFSAKRSN